MPKRDEKLDECLAVVSLLRSAEAGDAAAQYQLWRLYKVGHNDIAMSEDEALHWLKTSAEQGHAKANYELGELYKNENFPFATGVNISRDNTKAAGCFKRAFDAFSLGAKNDDAEACLYLSAMYYGGMGVKRDVDVSQKLLRRSAELGNEVAKRRLKEDGMDHTKSLLKHLFGCLALILCVVSAYATPQVTKVEAKQRYPWNGMVDITVTLSGSEEECSAATYSFYATNKATNAELPIRSVSRVGELTGLGDTWTRRFVWNATADVGRAKFGDVALTVGKPSVGVQLWENGPYWAECNVGARSPEEYGYYFWWGDTVGYKRNASDNGWISAKDGTSFSFNFDNCPTCGKVPSQLQSLGYIDSTGNLVAAHDAATVYLGEPWRLPKDAEISMLIFNCTTTWIVTNGVYGQLVTGKGDYASKSIFFPVAGFGNDASLDQAGLRGYYWSSTPYSNDRTNAWSLHFYSDVFARYNFGRYLGWPVRPLRGCVK